MSGRSLISTSCSKRLVSRLVRRLEVGREDIDRVKEHENTLSAVEDVLGYEFHDRSLLLLALCQKSYSNEQGWPLTESNELSLIHISEPTRLGMISYAVFC